MQALKTTIENAFYAKLKIMELSFRRILLITSHRKILMMAVIGPVIGAFALTFISELLRGFIYRARHPIYAALLVLFLMLMP